MEIDKEKEINALIEEFKTIRSTRARQLTGMYLDRNMRDPRLAIIAVKRNIGKSHGEVREDMGKAIRILSCLIDGTPLPHWTTPPPAVGRVI